LPLRVGKLRRSHERLRRWYERFLKWLLGRPRLKGKRLPNLSVVAECPSTRWEPVCVDECYGGEERALEVVSDTAVWHSTGPLLAVPLRSGC
jgi:hypothetical protein